MNHAAQRSRENMIRLITEAGGTLRECMEATGLSLSGVRDARHRLGIAGNPRNPPSHATLDAAQRMIDDGVSFAEVARTLGIGEGTLHRRFPGRAWGVDQVAEYNRMRRSFDHSEDFKVVFAGRESPRCAAVVTAPPADQVHGDRSE